MAKCVVFDDSLCIRTSDISYVTKEMPSGADKTYRVKIGLAGGHVRLLICKDKEQMEFAFNSIKQEMFDC